MEVYPHLYTSSYESILDDNIIQKRKIKCIIHISKRKRFLNIDDIEELRIPIEFNESDQDYNIHYLNIELHNYIHDMIDFIHDKLKECKSVLLLGYSHRQEIDSLVVGFYIKYGKVTPEIAINYLKSKKKNIFLPDCLYEDCLNRLYEDLHKK